MQKNLTSKNKRIIILATLTAIGILGIGVAILFTTMKAEAEAESSRQSQKPTFSFESSSVPSWWVGDNYWSDTGEAVSEKSLDADVPIVTMTVSQGTQEVPGGCFVTYSYLKGPIDTAVALKSMETRSVEYSEGLSLDKIGAQLVTMNTSEGSKEYQLHQYEFTGPASNTVAKGAQFAYVPLKDGYIEVRSYCEEAEQLAATSIVFSAVSFKL